MIIDLILYIPKFIKLGSSSVQKYFVSIKPSSEYEDICIVYLDPDIYSVTVQ